MLAKVSQAGRWRVSPTISRYSAPPAAAPSESPAEALLRNTRPDELTPREALDLTYRLKGSRD